MGQINSRLRRLEGGEAALFIHLRVSHINDSLDHSDDSDHQHRGCDQIDPDHHDEEDLTFTSRVCSKFTFIHITHIILKNQIVTVCFCTIAGGSG